MIKQWIGKMSSSRALKTGFFIALVLLTLSGIFLLSEQALAQRGGPPGRGPYIWQDGYWVHHPGPPADGYRWVPGRWRHGVWVDGYWAVYHPPSPYHVWVPGHWRGRVWVEGHWKAPHYRR